MNMTPLLIYDGDCGFCRRWIRHWQQLTGDRIAYAPFQEVAPQFPQIALEQFRASVHLVEPDGRVTRGAEAVLRTLADVPGKQWLWWSHRRLPGAATLFEWGYRLIAAHRGAAGRVTQWLWGPHVGPESFVVARWLFFRLLGITYLVAFVSLWTQIQGLVGPHGILPAVEFLQAVWRHVGPLAYWVAPTLCWLSANGTMLNFLCGAGALCAVLMILDLAPSVALVTTWVCYLSLTVVGQDFLAFQWDILLLETGFLAIWFARSDAMRWLLRWLLFRLTFSSGAVKLLSGDPTWRDLTALTYHYFTQPLPTWVGWYAHQLPARLHTISCVIMFAAELGAPFLIFAPRRPRAWGCLAMIALQLLIALTGNYTFFNLLTIALCLLLLDDAVWPRRLGQRLRRLVPLQPWPRWLVAPVAILLLLLSVVPMTSLFTGRLDPPWLAPWYHVAAPWYVVNSYGLFAVMTTHRPEIIIEGSRNGITWRAYEFRYQPGDPARRPAFVAPHQPRLDWQMWFAALGRCEENPWFLRFCRRLLHNTPEVTALLANNPFPEAPPRYLRATVYDYRFTDPATRRAHGTWWQRQRLGPYCPTFSIKESSHRGP